MVVLELDDLAAIDTNEVIVGRLFKEVGVVGRLAVTQIDFLEESGFRQKGESAVKGGPGCPVVRAPQLLPELVRGEVLIAGKDDLHDGIALWSVPEPLHFDEGVKPFADFRRHGVSMTVPAQG